MIWEKLVSIHTPIKSVFVIRLANELGDIATSGLSAGFAALMPIYKGPKLPKTGISIDERTVEHG